MKLKSLFLILWIWTCFLRPVWPDSVHELVVSTVAARSKYRSGKGNSLLVGNISELLNP